ncbi:hypothetical protein ACFP2F_11055 [Hymenobacter artigasi]|uniref:Alpha/beta hydrolase n=1 Tax=Hymenobacter artigasi TaxID=2719616 RepID=A0ABX1HIT9_9BACT|nr:hypothetical protein [Hymenobacter artigasi]NKI90189.1 hypothetical protein [Hymenobacter artigasi]
MASTPHLRRKISLVIASLICIGLLLAWLTTTGRVYNPIAGYIQTNPAHHAVYCCLKKARQAHSDGILRLYIDSGGNLYPDASCLPTNTGLRADVNNGSADLEHYYNHNAGLRDKLFAQYHQTPQLAGKAGVWNSRGWQIIQNQLTTAAVRQIDSTTQQGARPLIMLIHGYNVSDTDHLAAQISCDNSPCKNPSGHCELPEPYYSRVKDSLMATGLLPSNAVWLEVYWDGLQENPLLIWSAAQLSARYAGLRLREVLSQLDNRTPVRVLTHSSGAIVISQALWNNDAFNGGGSAEDDLTAWAAATSTPTNPDIRVGMLVPALTSQAFTYYGQRTPQVTSAQMVGYRLVVGRNERDYAINKKWVGAEKAGATGMGASLCALKYAAEQTAHYPIDLRPIGFCTSTSRKDTPKQYQHGAYEEHDWLVYFKRQAIMKDFLKQVFE